jgi:hypothetical protein
MGPKLVFPPILMVNWVSSYLSFFLSASTSCYIYFHCSYLDNYYNYSWTLCIKCWDIVKFPYFAAITERGDSGWKQAQREGEDRVTLQIIVLSHTFSDHEISNSDVKEKQRLSALFLVLFVEWQFIILSSSHEAQYIVSLLDWQFLSPQGALDIFSKSNRSKAFAHHLLQVRRKNIATEYSLL